MPSGPWDKYQDTSQPAQSEGPWQKYQDVPDKPEESSALQIGRGLARGTAGQAMNAIDLARNIPKVGALANTVRAIPGARQAVRSVRGWIDQPDKSGWETAARMGGSVLPYLAQPEIGLEAMAARALPWIPRAARFAGRLLEGGAKGATAGAVNDPEHPLEGAEAGAIGGAALPATSSFMRGPIATATGKIAKHAAGAGIAHAATPFAGPMGYALWPATTFSRLGRGVERAGHWVMDRAGRVVGFVPRAAGGVAGGELARDDEQPVSRQEGGPLEQDQPAVVGEEGPELFVPDRPGTVVPTRKIPREVPQVTQARALRDFLGDVSGLSDVVKAAREGGTWTDVGAAAIPAAIGALQPEARAAGVAEKAAGTAWRDAPYAAAKFKKFAEEYPPVGKGVPSFDKKTGKFYMGKNDPPETAAFTKERKRIMGDMKKNPDWPRYFDPEERFHADPSNYPPMIDTASQVPVRADTIAKYTAQIDAPETRAALQKMYAVGQTVPNAKNWYAMGQLERAYIDEFGPEVGRTRFRNDFAGAMAATTGGADPTANFLMAHYSNFMRNRGEKFPTVTESEQRRLENFAKKQGGEYAAEKTGDIASYKVPYPVGGQYAATNLKMYNRVFRDVAQGKDIGQALMESNPKRLDFTQALIGNPESFTWDKQMSTGAGFGDRPPSYGIAERVAREEAAKAGVTPRDFQDVGWAGEKKLKEEAKGRTFQYTGPMIEHVNASIERTHRLTGMPRSEIVRRGLLRGDIPMYGLGALAAAAAAQDRDQQ